MLYSNKHFFEREERELCSPETPLLGFIYKGRLPCHKSNYRDHRAMARGGSAAVDPTLNIQV